MHKPQACLAQKITEELPKFSSFPSIPESCNFSCSELQSLATILEIFHNLWYYAPEMRMGKWVGMEMENGSEVSPS